MSKRFVVSAFLCTALIFACSTGGSGVSGGKLVVSLSDDDVDAVCAYVVDVLGPERTVDCGGGTRVTIGGGTIDECIDDVEDSQVQSPNCNATVADVEVCVETFADFTDAELCGDPVLPSACLALFACGEIF